MDGPEETMRYTIEADRETAALEADLEPVVRGLGFALVELDLYRTKKTARVRLIVTRPPADPPSGAPEAEGREGNGNGPGAEDLARVHRALIPRLELALGGPPGGPGGAELYVEVSSPGLARIIKEGREFRHYTGRPLRCYLTGASEWRRGILRGSDGEKILLSTEEGTIEVKYEHIAKARLDG